VTLGPWEVLLVIAKALGYAATLGAAGGVFFVTYSRPLLATPSDRRIRRWLGVLLVVAALASGAKVLLMAASMSGEPAGMFDGSLDAMILRSGEGWAIALRLLGLAGAAWAVVARRPSVPALLGAVALATSFARVGHVHAMPSNAFPTLVLVVHLLAAAFWLGALMPLALVARDADVSRVASVTSRFGTAALLVVPALLGAGVCLLCLLLHSLSSLWNEDYGRLVMLKLVGVAALLALAAFNHLRVTPRLLAGDARAVATLRRSVAVEITVACAVLIITAAMSTLAGP
jgi:putative copper resistance protein D